MHHSHAVQAGLIHIRASDPIMGRLIDWRSLDLKRNVQNAAKGYPTQAAPRARSHKCPMLHQDSIVIHASPDKVWEYLALPELWELFHAKVDGCELVSTEGGRIGSVYTIGFRMGNTIAPTRCEIIDLRPGRMIQVQSVVVDPAKPAPSATITFELDDLGTKTRVRERVEITAPEMNVFPRVFLGFLFWFFNRFAHPAGETTLMKLKAIVEG